jgi:integrase
MMKLDLEQARKAWIDEAKKDRKERKRREETDYLQYQDENGLYADFHANRHTFISNLAKSGVSPKVAQTMARHSDINLTMNVYSHVKMEEQEAAIAVLPAPPAIDGNGKSKRRKSGA